MNRKALALPATLLAGVAGLCVARAADAPDPAAMLDKMKSTVLSKGPNGEAAVSADGYTKGTGSQWPIAQAPH